MNSFNTATPKFDNLLLHRLQLHPPPSTTTPPPLEDILFNNENDNNSPSSSKTQLAKEEAKLEKEIIRTILEGKSDALKPNSGQAVTISDHHICVGFHLVSGSEYRVWEWHGHIMLFDEVNGYTPEYIYGNYFERLSVKEMVDFKNKEKVENSEKVENFAVDDDEKKVDEKDVKASTLGLKDLIESGGLSGGRILHRNINAGSSRFML